MPRIAILHPGEMGAAIGVALVETGAEVCWLESGRSEATRRRAEEAGLEPVGDLAGVDLVMSVCPPGAALDVARQVAGFQGTYLDANAVSPATAAQVAEVVTTGGATYVDGGIIGGPPTPGDTTRLYLSGERAEEVSGLFAVSGMEAHVLTAGDFAASALKMAYASWTKVSAALLLAGSAAAERLGVAEALHTEWAISQPELADRLAAATRSAQTKGWRWEAEMREIAATFAAQGQPDGFGAAAADIFSRYPRPE